MKLPRPFRSAPDPIFGEVERVERLSPSLLRVTLGGGTLDRFEASECTDAYINASFLPAESPLAVPFDEGTAKSVSQEHRPRPRRFTVRRWDAATGRLTIDFVRHGDVGYAGSWAARAACGDRLQFKGPGGSYRPSAKVDWHLLAGDESTFGAIGASLESLEPSARAVVFVLVDGPAHRIEFPTVADVTIHWLHRTGAADPVNQLAGAIAQAELPGGTYDVFLHGEAAEVRAARRHLIVDRGVDPKNASISPYWRRRHTDEDWRAVKRQWMTEQARDA